MHGKVSSRTLEWCLKDVRSMWIGCCKGVEKGLKKFQILTPNGVAYRVFRLLPWGRFHDVHGLIMVSTVWSLVATWSIVGTDFSGGWG